MSKKPTLTVKDFTSRVREGIKALKSMETLVGIPAPNGARKPEPGETINNAALLFINEFGSPANNIPARHPMKTGLKLAKDAISKEFANAAKSVLSKGFDALDVYYERAGIIASNSVKRVINEQIDMPGPSEATLKSRERAGFKGTKSLVVTGQMRNAITYVVRSK